MTDASQARVCVLDYGAGNVGSVFNALSPLAPTKISNNSADLRDATHIVLPGVGAFAAAMTRIQERLPIDLVRQQVEGGKPFLGICVGLQVLAERGFEFGEHAGLGLLRGEVRKMSVGDLPLPHVGWNSIETSDIAHPLLRRFPASPDFYFVHSYCFDKADEKQVLARTEYGESFPCVLGRDNIVGVQFHPEKSQKAGRALLENFLAL